MQSVAVVGAGAMGKVHAKIYAKMENVCLKYIVDVNAQKALELAHEVGCSARGGISEMKVGEVDVIDICLPTFLHIDAIFQASEVARNILCEKPLSIHLEDVARVENLVRKKGLRLMVAQVVRFTDAYVRAAELVAAGRIGPVNSAVCYRRQKRPGWAQDNWFANEEMSGGLTYDLAIHDIDYLVHLLGKPEAVFARTVRDEAGRPVHLRAELVYNRCVATLFSSWGLPEGWHGGTLEYGMEILGQCGRIWLNESGEMLLSDLHETQKVPVKELDGYQAELAYFMKCCAEGRDPVRADIFAVGESLLVAKAIVISQKESRVVRISEIEE